MKQETLFPRKSRPSLSGIFSYRRSGIFGIDLISVDIEFFFGVANRDIGQHEDLMGGKNSKVLARKDYQFVPVGKFNKAGGRPSSFHGVMYGGPPPGSERSRGEQGGGWLPPCITP